MRSLASALILLLFGIQPSAGPDARIGRVERWLTAVQYHHVGTFDRSAREIAAWSDADLSTLWTDVRALSLLMRNVQRTITYTPVGARLPAPVYRKPQAERMQVLACAAAGIVNTDPWCVKARVGDQLTDDLRRLATLSVDGAGAGADNYVLKYGALLHTDIAVAAPPTIAPLTQQNAGAQRLRVELTDGQPRNVGQSAVHWEIARVLLDGVRGSRTELPAPGRDTMVRDWYRATAAWMQFNVHYDSNHLDHGRELFPNDRDLLFLSGTLHAIYATPRIQSAIKNIALPRGFSMDAKADVGELRQAKTFLRRVTSLDAGFGEAHLRLARVLALDGDMNGAARELAEAATVSDDPDKYYRALFEGDLEETQGHFDAARDSYQAAAVLFPEAQSPLLALAQLLRREGNRSAALDATRRVFALDPNASERRDPWWVFDVWQAREGDAELDAVLAPFRQKSEP